MVFPNYHSYSPGDYYWMPTNFIFLASTLIDHGYSPILIDDRVLTREQTLEQIEQNIDNSLVVLISTATGSQLYNTRRLAQYIKKRSNIPICVGGSHPSALPELMLTDPNIDYVIVGQGEYAVNDLCDALVDANSLEDKLNSIPNLYYRNHLQNVVKSKAAFEQIRVDDLPALPYFNRKFINVHDYLNPETKAVNYTTSSGCVGRCAFCFFYENYKYSFFSPERVISDLKRFKDEFGIRNVNFDDPTFFVNTKRVVEIAKLMIEEGINVKWRGNARVNTLKQFTENELIIIRESGCEVAHVGLESGSKRIIKLMNKHINPEDTIKLIQISKSTGIIFRFHILVGIPTETIEDLKQTGFFLRRLLKIYPDFDYTVSFFTPYPGNSLTFLAEKYGYTPPIDLEGYEKLELFTIANLPESDREYVKRISPWEKEFYVRIPWFTEEFNQEYLRVFKKVIPRKETIRTTDSRVEHIYIHE